MTPPIAITFHFPPSSSSSSSSAIPPSSRTLSKRKIANNSRISTTPYITIDKPSKTKTTSSIPTTIPSPVGTSSATSSSETPTSASTISNGSKRRKGPVYVIPPSNVKLASLTPLLRPIVSRCTNPSTSSGTGINEENTFSPSRKRSKKLTPMTITPFLHPYSRSSDLSNTRSSIPSPKEIVKAQKAEEEKARLKKENAALARAATIAKRKSARKSGRTGGITSKVMSRRSSMENSITSKPNSPEEISDLNGIPVITTQSASEENSPILGGTAGGGRSTGMKRTRSQGVLPIAISTNIQISVHGSPVIGSPLKEVMSREGDEEGDGEPRKRSKLGNEELSTRRANTLSPIGTPSDLPEEDERLTKTVPLSYGKVLPPKYPQRASSQTPSVTTNEGIGSTLLRRSVSNSTPTYGRAGSVGSTGSASDSGRIKRETQLPERLRDYEMKAAI
ncbi:uncharacterized protein IL334_006976 [Kwoniella shivajii]|uniref:Shugoshin C-terminal domain-containing protein n=1 Tax=Kwoniella shivajii TaxID=564305 RepID=A0ABZ1D7F2_9TREE|nr:hypothetical protein IL334_006976 [Kwoniella shivajii]